MHVYVDHRVRCRWAADHLAPEDGAVVRLKLLDTLEGLDWLPLEDFLEFVAKDVVF